MNTSLEEIIRAVQAELKISVDGKAGPETWQAVYARIVGRPALPRAVELDARSKVVIDTLESRVQPYARALVEKAAAIGITLKIISGRRTFAEQDALYAQGRTRPGKIVTKARAGYSCHNFGIAFDVGVFERGRYRANSPVYKAVGALGQELGLEWGGSWKTLRDEPHFQLRPAWAKGLSQARMLAGLRKQFPVKR